MKRPVLLVVRRSDEAAVGREIGSLGGATELPFTPEARLGGLLERAVMAIECENSLWKAARMPGYGAPLTPQRRLGGRPGLPKSAVAPTIIIKREDLRPLGDWELSAHVPIHIWHAFFDLAFGLSFRRAEELISAGDIAPTDQTFQSPGGVVTRKQIFKIYYQHAYQVGRARSEPELLADSIEDKNGHILPFVRFEGGRLTLDPAALSVLRKEAAERTC